MAVLEKAQINDMIFKDYYCSWVPKKKGVKKLIMEGSENCLKAEVHQGPPLNFDEPRVTIVSAHVYQGSSKGNGCADPKPPDIQNLGKQLALARKEAGTMAWLGDEAKRRETMKVRPMACGVIRKAVESPPVPLLSPSYSLSAGYRCTGSSCESFSFSGSTYRMVE